MYNVLERLYKNLQTDNSDTFVDKFAILKEAAPIEKKKVRIIDDAAIIGQQIS